MMLSNIEKSRVSYRHKNKIQGLFDKHIKKNLLIDHFSINFFYNGGKSLFLSPTPQMAEELCKHNFVDVDSNYSPEVYTKYQVYPWRLVQRTETDKVINFVKEEKFQMRNGAMFVRSVGKGCYAMYSIATHHPDPRLLFLYMHKANEILQMGDFMYNELRYIVGEHIGDEIYPPKIEMFRGIEHSILPSKNDIGNRVLKPVLFS